MFEFSLKNGKKQIVDGVRLLIAAAVIGAIYGLIAGIMSACGTSPKAIIIVSIIWGLSALVSLVLGCIKLAFGGIVYHAERTSARDEKSIYQDNEASNK